jgi:hypothetical protein
MLFNNNIIFLLPFKSLQGGMNNFEISTPSVQKEAFSEAERAKIFYLIFITCLMINLDHGIIPAGIFEITMIL